VGGGPDHAVDPAAAPFAAVSGASGPTSATATPAKLGQRVEQPVSGTITTSGDTLTRARTDMNEADDRSSPPR
jgi:hypothetical protein